jgi:hypothetical protein
MNCESFFCFLLTCDPSLCCIILIDFLSGGVRPRCVRSTNPENSFPTFRLPKKRKIAVLHRAISRKSASRELSFPGMALELR